MQIGLTGCGYPHRCSTIHMFACGSDAAASDVHRGKASVFELVHFRRRQREVSIVVCLHVSTEATAYSPSEERTRAEILRWKGGFGAVELTA